MANTKQSKKRARQSLKRNEYKSAQRSQYRTAVKRVREAVETGDQLKALEVFRLSMSVMDSLAGKKVVHKNKASRHKSRLSAAISHMVAAS